MRTGRDLIDVPIYTVNNGRHVGRVYDLYLDADLHRVSGIYLGSEGFFKKKSSAILRDDVVLLGVDAVLARNEEVVRADEELTLDRNWLRRSALRGRPVATPGGTRIGQIGDVILNDDGQLVGFTLSHVYVEGPIASNKAISRRAIIDHGNGEGVMTLDLAQAEQENLRVIQDTPFAEPTVAEEPPAEELPLSVARPEEPE